MLARGGLLDESKVDWDCEKSRGAALVLVLVVVVIAGRSGL